MVIYRMAIRFTLTITTSLKLSALRLLVSRIAIPTDQAVKKTLLVALPVIRLNSITSPIVVLPPSLFPTVPAINLVIFPLKLRT